MHTNRQQKAHSVRICTISLDRTSDRKRNIRYYHGSALIGASPTHWKLYGDLLISEIKLCNTTSRNPRIRCQSRCRVKPVLSYPEHQEPATQVRSGGTATGSFQPDFFSLQIPNKRSIFSSKTLFKNIIKPPVLSERRRSLCDISFTQFDLLFARKPKNPI